MSDEGESGTNFFHGNISDIPFIGVDNFLGGKKKAYFMSHMHYDHNQNLFFDSQLRSNLERNNIPIYMSVNTATVFNDYAYKWFTVKNNIRSLETGIPLVIDVPGEKPFEVTLIEVEHMFGAVMFLFKYDDKTILFTGDFVVETDDVKKIKELHDENGKPIKIDVMYVDQTFNHEAYSHFPRRRTCEREVVEKAREWLDADINNRLILHSTTNFSYDLIYKALYEELKIKIKMHPQNPNILNVYRAMYRENKFLSDDDNCRIHIIPRKYRDIAGRERNKAYLYIYMSAQRGFNYDSGKNALTCEEVDLYYLCYPTHCSKSQLDYFIKYFGPESTEKFPTIPVEPPSQKGPY